jgi:hypothetical protein
MDEDTKKYFDTVVAKDVNDLTPQDKAFLRARYDYLDRHNRKRLDPILQTKDPEPEVVEEPTDPNAFSGTDVDTQPE